MGDIQFTLKCWEGWRTTVCVPSGVKLSSQRTCAEPPSDVDDPVQISICHVPDCQSESARFYFCSRQIAWFFKFDGGGREWERSKYRILDIRPHSVRISGDTARRWFHICWIPRSTSPSLEGRHTSRFLGDMLERCMMDGFEGHMLGKGAVPPAM